VLSELANVLSKKYSFSWQQIASVYKELTNLFDIVLIKPESVRKAIEISEQYRYSYYDSLILASALEAECSILYSEDFQHGQIIEGMKIINPFV
jgi:predicted nucleic acid-binding protein